MGWGTSNFRWRCCWYCLPYIGWLPEQEHRTRARIWLHSFISVGYYLRYFTSLRTFHTLQVVSIENYLVCNTQVWYSAGIFSYSGIPSHTVIYVQTEHFAPGGGKHHQLLFAHSHIWCDHVYLPRSDSCCSNVAMLLLAMTTRLMWCCILAQTRGNTLTRVVSCCFGINKFETLFHQ